MGGDNKNYNKKDNNRIKRQHCCQNGCAALRESEMSPKSGKLKAYFVR